MVPEKNLENTKALVCPLRYIRGKWSEVTYKRRATGEGGNFRERKQERISCTVCVVTVASSYLKGHMFSQHGRIPPHTRVEIGGGNNYPCGFFPLGAEDGEMPGAGMYGSSA